MDERTKKRTGAGKGEDPFRLIPGFKPGAKKSAGKAKLPPAATGATTHRKIAAAHQKLAMLHAKMQGSVENGPPRGALHRQAANAYGELAQAHIAASTHTHPNGDSIGDWHDAAAVEYAGQATAYSDLAAEHDAWTNPNDEAAAESERDDDDGDQIEAAEREAGHNAAGTLHSELAGAHEELAGLHTLTADAGDPSDERAAALQEAAALMITALAPLAGPMGPMIAGDDPAAVVASFKAAMSAYQEAYSAGAGTQDLPGARAGGIVGGGMPGTPYEMIAAGLAQPYR